MRDYNNRHKDVQMDLVPRGPQSLEVGDRYMNVRVGIDNATGCLTMCPHRARDIMMKSWTLNNKQRIYNEYTAATQLSIPAREAEHALGVSAVEYWGERKRTYETMTGQIHGASMDRLGEITKVTKKRIWVNGHNDKSDWVYSLRSTPVGEFWVRHNQQVGAYFYALCAIDQLDWSNMQTQFENWLMGFWEIEKEDRGSLATLVADADDSEALQWVQQLIMTDMDINTTGEGWANHNITYKLNTSFFDVEEHHKRMLYIW
jgi:hypothetical protein